MTVHKLILVGFDLPIKNIFLCLALNIFLKIDTILMLKKHKLSSNGTH